MGIMPVIVAVSGAFDPIHAGHVRYIKEAAKLGDKLVVILNTDDFLIRKKGFVFMPFNERQEILENIKGVSIVMASIDEDQTVNKTLELIDPDIFAKGGDIINPLEIPEAATCNKLGCKLVTNVGGYAIHPNIVASLNLMDLGIDTSRKLLLNCPYCDDHPILKGKCLYCKGKGKIAVEKVGRTVLSI